MRSVLAQTHPSIDYVVIDGGSNDGTVAQIRQHAARLAYWVSEPDGGIYEAMNKAIRQARGEWILFLNAGDYLVAPTVLESALRLGGGEADFIYGDSEFELPNKQVLVKARPLDVMWQRISFSHQSLLARTSLMRANPFDCSYKVVADFAFYFKMYARGARFAYVPIAIASILPGGFSEKKLVARTVERWHVARTYRPGWETDTYYARLMCRQILPQAVARSVRNVSAPVLRITGKARAVTEG